MVSMKVSVKTAGVLKYLATIQKKQIPYATSQALNSTIFDVRKQVTGETYRQAFNVRNARFSSAAFRVEKANKRKLAARVYDRLGRASLDLHADGGTKLPKGGSLAIPTDKINRTASGKISKARKPRNLKRSFLVKFKSGKRAIAQRRGKSRLPIDVVYYLEKSARINKRFNFERDAEKVANRNYPRHWEREFARAVRTAR